MRRRRGLVVAGAALAMASAGGLAAVNAAAAAPATHTLKFIAVTVSTSTPTKTGHYYEADVDVSNAVPIANDVLSCVAGSTSETCWVALANSKGMLYGHFGVSFSTGILTGKITSGSGAYKNATGTISGTLGSAGEAVTVVYST